jgi:branched-chain amino acid transport system substrate-binding protein
MKASWLCGLPVFAVAFAALVASRADADELRIGFLMPVTGPLAQIATDSINGFKMYLDDHKGEFHGATVKFIVEDTQAKPATAVLKAEKLIK